MNRLECDHNNYQFGNRNTMIPHADQVMINFYRNGGGSSAQDFYRELLMYLDHKRVLYYGCEGENTTRCTESVLEVKKDLKDRIQGRGLSCEDLRPIDAMMYACNNYLDLIEEERNCGHNCRLKAALIALREGFKNAIEYIESTYSLKFNHEILPPCGL